MYIGLTQHLRRSLLCSLPSGTPSSRFLCIYISTHTHTHTYVFIHLFIYIGLTRSICIYMHLNISN